MARRFLVPAEVAPSITDCGPAVLTAALRGFGLAPDEAGLRHSWLPDDDGPSVAVLAALAGSLGLVAREVTVPTDHVVRQGARLPAVVATLRPDGTPHLLLLWRRVGPLVEVMDPAVGRRWLRPEAVRRTLRVHRRRISAEEWRASASTADQLAALRGRLRDVGEGFREIDRLVTRALDDPDWRAMARLDGACRAVAALVDEGVVALHRGVDAVEDLLSRPDPERAIGERCLAVSSAGRDDDGSEWLWVRGASLVTLSAPPRSIQGFPVLDGVVENPGAPSPPTTPGDIDPDGAYLRGNRRANAAEPIVALQHPRRRPGPAR